MSSVRGKNNRSTELCLRMALTRSGIKGWELHPKELPGNPDFYFPDIKLALFVDGCFWHGCPKCGHIPKTRTEFWKEKINLTKKRDRKKRAELNKIGISTLGIWEHELKERTSLIKTVNKIIRKIQKLQTQSSTE